MTNLRFLLETLRQVLSEARCEARLVGGVVRDLLLGREPADLDVVVDGPALSVARALADAVGGAFYVLDERREFGRVVWRSPDGRRVHVDLARREGGSWEEDLRRRDFTVNAMMAEIETFLRPEGFVPFDPLGGLEDLRKGWLRPCAPDAFQNDPARTLRAVRLEAELGLRLTPEAEAALAKAVPLLVRVSTERIRDELVKILLIPPVVWSLRRMNALGLLERILPEVADLRGLLQGPPHRWDAYAHTIRVVAAMERLMESETDAPELRDLPARWSDAEKAMAPWLDRLRSRWDEEVVAGRPRRALLLLAALLHDIGKARTRAVDPDGRVRFIGHEAVGAEMAASRMRALRFSSEEVEEVAVLVRHHMRPGELARELTPRAIRRFLRNTGERGADAALLSLADTLAVWGSGLPEEVWAARLTAAQAIWHAIFEAPERFVRVTPLVRGDDLLAMGVPEGPQIGHLLEAIREAQAAGEVTTWEEALALARRLIEETGAWSM